LIHLRTITIKHLEAMRRFNKLEEAVLKMVHKRNKIDSIEGMEWDEYGNPLPIVKQAGENNPDDDDAGGTESIKTTLI